MFNNWEFIFSNFLINLAVMSPVMITLIVGIVIAIIRWRTAKKISLLTILAMVIVLFGSLFNALLNSSAFQILYGFGVAVGMISAILTIASIVLNLIFMGAWVLILIAIFAGRKPPEEPAKIN